MSGRILIAVLLIAAPAAGQAVAPRAPGDESPPISVIELILTPRPPTASDRELAGLPEQAAAETLTWERVYTMALVRARAGGAMTAEPPDAQARRLGLADFARFRREFVAGRAEAGGAFHDPGGAYLAVLRRLQAIDDARRYTAALENFRILLQELIRAESRGLIQLDIDAVAEALTRGREQASMEVAGLRDGLDELKVALGLSPQAAVVPDRRDLAAFRDVFAAAERWSFRPDRNLAELPRIIERLPAPGDVIVDGRPILGVLEQTPARMEDLLRDAARLAIKNRPGSDNGPAAKGEEVALELRVRRRIRHLLELRRGYEPARRSYERAVRLRDMAFDQIFRPAGIEGPALRSPAIEGVVAILRRIPEAEDRLTALWTAFRAERLALYRDLGVLPYDNWDAFYGDLSARPVDARPAPPSGAPLR